jgi:hypothetical protein
MSVFPVLVLLPSPLLLLLLLLLLLCASGLVVRCLMLHMLWWHRGSQRTRLTEW